MADIRINALATTAASTASDDFIAVDGSANGTRKLDAYSPTFGGNLTVSGGTVGTAAATNLTLAGGSSGASLVLGQGASGTNVLSVPAGSVIAPSTFVKSGVAKTDTTQRDVLAIGSNDAANPFQLIVGVTGGAAIANRNVELFTRDSGVGRGGSLSLQGSLTGGNVLIGGTTDITGSGGLKVFGTTAATSTTTGALQVAGGVGIAGAAFVGGNLTVSGASFVSGSGIVGGTPVYRVESGFNSPLASATGAGIELWNAGIQSYNRTSNAFAALTLDGSSITLGASGRNTTVAGNLTVSGGTITSGSGTLTLNSSANTVVLQSAGTTALTLDSSQNATFAGKMGIGGASVASSSLILRGLSLTTGANQIGVDQQTTFNSDATTSGRGISSVVVTKAASFTMANGVAFYAVTPVLGAGSAITTNTGLYVANQGSTGITNAYGIDIAAQSGAATTNVAIRAAGKIMFTSLPTSSVGLASGELWNDSGTVKIA